MKKLRVLVLTHQDIELPDSLDGLSESEIKAIKTEYDVVTALEHLGHEVRTLAAPEDMTDIRRVLFAWKPHVVFNLLEEFRGEGIYVPYLLGYLELIGQAFTGCNPAGLLLADRKITTKKVLRYHRIPVPDFAVFPLGRKVRRPKKLEFPLIVKSATEHGSVGISQASIVNSDEKLAERVAYVHEQIGTDAVAEAYIQGRELNLGLIGNNRVEALLLWELYFEKMAPGVHAIATARVKWDLEYQEKRGITMGPAENLPPGVESKIVRMARRVYRILGLNGYARMDFRLTDDGKIYLLEPNPNPDLAHDEDFSESAIEKGLDYDEMIQRIVNLGIRYNRERNQHRDERA
ncbi:MAG: ATP-grasp domain-containing protein [Phycisphaerales bacterium]|nr:ATP-grasp domain-containing protein [Phycisphaerales bacterium]MCB9864169.1 ATP-grasp domain-containing protein [Phycisphaerales bacterium]